MWVDRNSCYVCTHGRIPSDVTEEQIRDRSKGDPITKSIIVIQTAWFVVQTVHRLSLHFPVTELEYVALAYTVVNFFVYWCWWYKPLGIAFPIDIPAKKQAVNPAGEKEPPVVEKTEEKPEQQELDRVLKDAQLVAPTIAKGDDQDQSTGNGDDGDEGHQASKDTTSVVEENVQPPNTLNDGGGENLAKSNTGNEEDYPTVNTQPAVDIESNTFPPARLSFRAKLGSNLESISDPGRLHLSGLIILSAITFIISGAFGGMHCLAWNSDFPSYVERICWRVASLLVTSIGAIMMVVAIHISPERGWWKGIVALSIMVLLTVVYCCARLALLVVALLQLRDLPFGAFLTPSWTVFYPHIN